MKTESEDVKGWFKSMDFDDDGFVDFYEWGRLLDDTRRLGHSFQVFNLASGTMQPLIPNLSDNEEQEVYCVYRRSRDVSFQLANMMQRIIRVAEHALSKGVRIMIDAEQSYFQPAISRLTLELMRK